MKETTIKESPNGTLTADPPTPSAPPAPQPTPAEALKQVVALADSLGYILGVVALTPKTRTPIPIIEYLPDGVTVQLALMRKDGYDPLLPAKD